MEKDVAIQVLPSKPMEINKFKEERASPQVLHCLSARYLSPSCPRSPHPRPIPCLPQEHPSYRSFCLSPFFSCTWRQKKTRADGAGCAPLPPPCICHRCVETSLPTRRVQQDIYSSLVTSPSLSVICKRPGLNCRFLSRLDRTHAAAARLSRSLPWCRGAHFWQPGDAGELADVKHIHGSDALNSTFFF